MIFIICMTLVMMFATIALVAVGLFFSGKAIKQETRPNDFDELEHCLKEINNDNECDFFYKGHP